MIHYIKHAEIDKKKWDEIIRLSPNGLIYAYSWYLDIVSPGWEALINDEFTTVMPLTNNKKFGIKYLFPPFFVQQLGVFSLSKIKPEEVDNFIKAIPVQYKYIEILMNSTNESLNFNNSINLNNNLELMLSSNYLDLFNSYSENTRRSVKKAIKNDLQEIDLEDPSAIIDLFRSNRGKRINLKDKHYNLFKKLCTASSENITLQIKGIKAHGELIAGAVFFIDSKRAIFIFSGAADQAKEKRAMFLLIDNFIKKNAGSNLILDFEGSNNQNLARFYKGFGALESKYPSLKINRLPWLLKNFKK